MSVKAEVGMKFYDNNGLLHRIDKIEPRHGGGFYHSYNDGKKSVRDAFMLDIAFKRLQECNALYIII